MAKNTGAERDELSKEERTRGAQTSNGAGGQGQQGGELAEREAGGAGGHAGAGGQGPEVDESAADRPDEMGAGVDEGEGQRNPQGAAGAKHGHNGSDRADEMIERRQSDEGVGIGRREMETPNVGE